MELLVDPGAVTRDVDLRPALAGEQFTGAGHHIHHDDPDRLFALLREFLTEPAVAGVP
jgi:hypothetical protein